MGDERPAGAGVAVQQLEDAAGQVEQLDQARAGERRLLRRLVDHGVARDERGGDLAAGDRDGSFHGTSSATTPRGSWTIRSAAPQPPCSVRPRCSGPELGVLLDRADAGLDAAERVGQRLAALPGLQLGELLPRARAGGGRRP